MESCGGIRIGVCDSHPVMALGIRAILRDHPGMVVAWAVSSLEELRARRQEAMPAVVLMDKAFGLQTIAAFALEWREQGRPAVVVWGTSVTEMEVVRLVQAGVKGILSKSIEPEGLVSCLGAAARGQTWIEDAIFRSRARMSARKTKYGLTPRESEVFRLVRIGLSNQEIAEELGISPGTVKIHLRHLYEKTGLRGRFQLALADVHAEEPLGMTA
jgi:DNA-binding NarL/FixJ family response regulator